MNKKIPKNLTVEQIKSDMIECLAIGKSDAEDIKKALAENRFKNCVDELKLRKLDADAVIADAYLANDMEVPKGVKPSEVKEVGDPFDETTAEADFVPMEQGEKEVFVPKNAAEMPKETFVAPVVEKLTLSPEDEKALMIMKIFRITGMTLEGFEKAFAKFLKNAGREMAETGTEKTTEYQKMAAWTGLVPYMVKDVNAYRQMQDRAGKSVIRLINAENSLQTIYKDMLTPML